MGRGRSRMDNPNDAHMAKVLTDEARRIAQQHRQAANPTQQRWLSVGFGRQERGSNVTTNRNSWKPLRLCGH